MPDLTRRHALQAVASGLAALAGCAGEPERPTIDRRGNRRSVLDYDVRSVRNEAGAVLFTTREQLPTVTDEEARFARLSRRVLVSEAGIDELTFGTVPEAEELRSFAAATNFDSSSLYLLAMPVEACKEIRLQSATVEWDELEGGDLHPHAQFCETFRPADVDCAAGEIHTAGFAIRLPIAAERSRGSGRGMSSSCRLSPHGEYFNATVTPARGGGDE
ncbi:hypothetical protein [Halobellus marinus]|uniref:hypothetical protein n=1 Tax=Halobellus TaxID=1073986 RepID=UPI0028AA7374|nr:hypothetical protein [Halobellus sp. DFY28]